MTGTSRISFLAAESKGRRLAGATSLSYFKTPNLPSGGSYREPQGRSSRGSLCNQARHLWLSSGLADLSASDYGDSASGLILPSPAVLHIPSLAYSVRSSEKVACLFSSFPQ